MRQTTPVPSPVVRQISKIPTDLSALNLRLQKTRTNTLRTRTTLGSDRFLKKFHIPGQPRDCCSWSNELDFSKEFSVRRLHSLHFRLANCL